MHRDRKNIKIAKPIRTCRCASGIPTGACSLGFYNKMSLTYVWFASTTTLHLNLDTHPAFPILNQEVIGIALNKIDDSPVRKFLQYLNQKHSLGNDAFHPALREIGGSEYSF